MDVVWFSAGVSSAVTAWLVKDIPNIKLIYIHINDQHPDSTRFLIDCEKWLNFKIDLLRGRYRSVEESCLSTSFIKSRGGAVCTRILKRDVRKEWEYNNPGSHTYYWGLDVGEKSRVDNIILAMPDHEHKFPLIEAGLTKQDAHGVLTKEGIIRPEMYNLGYPNNNCIGCVKGGLGYWNKIRKDFPEVFKARAELERKLNFRILREGFLDEIDPKRGRKKVKPIVEECGVLCELTYDKVNRKE